MDDSLLASPYPSIVNSARSTMSMDVDSMFQRNDDKLRQLQALTVDDDGLTREPDTDELDALLSRFLNPQKGGATVENLFGGGGGGGGGGAGDGPLLSNRSTERSAAAQKVGDWLAEEPSLRSDARLLPGHYQDD